MSITSVFCRNFQDQLRMEGSARQMPTTPSMRGDWHDTQRSQRGGHRHPARHGRLQSWLSCLLLWQLLAENSSTLLIALFPGTVDRVAG